MRTLYCSGCKIKVANIIDGNIKKGAVMLCSNCELKRIASDMKNKNGYMKNKNGYESQDFADIFKDVFKNDRK